MGAPVKAKAIVKMLSDGSFKNDGPMNAGVETSMGPTAVLRIGGIDVVTISNRIQTIDLQVFLSQGIDPTAKSVLVVKSVQHFRAAYAPIAREIVLVDSGGICSPDIARLKFTKLRRPIWPFDGINDPYAGLKPRLATFGHNPALVLVTPEDRHVESVFSAAATLRSHRCGGRRRLGRRRLLSLRSPAAEAPPAPRKTSRKRAARRCDQPRRHAG